jgi:hypothetical protein
VRRLASAAAAGALCLAAAGAVARAEGGTADTQARRLGDASQVTPTLPAPPAPYEWTGPIPSAYVGLACSRDQASEIARRYMARGASEDTVRWALLMISRESGCRWWVHNYNRATRDDSYSLCQLNAMSGHFGPGGVLSGWDRWRMLDDFAYAVDACVEMWTACGRGPWQPPYGCRAPNQ